MNVGKDTAGQEVTVPAAGDGTEPRRAGKSNMMPVLAAVRQVRERAGGKVYAVAGRHCGHVIGTPPSRAAADAIADRVTGPARHHIRVRLATDQDIMAHLSGTSCPSCGG